MDQRQSHSSSPGWISIPGRSPRTALFTSFWRFWHQPLGFLVMVAGVPIALWWWRQRLGTLFFAVSADDFHRTLLAWEVTQGNLVPSYLWPPLQFWIEALVLHLYPHLLSVPSLVNITASSLSVACLLWLGRTWGLNGWGAIIATILITSLPWFVWLSLSGLAEPLFFLGITAAYLGVARWFATQRSGWLWLAGGALLGAGMLRFDAWGHSVVFSLALLWYWWRRPAGRHWSLWIIAALPWTFPLLWIFWQWLRFGDPFYFSWVTREYWLQVHGPLPLATRILWQPRDLWRHTGILLPIALIGLWLWRKRPGLPVLALMWLSSFALLMQSTLDHTITQNNPTRLVVVHTLLLLPAAAFALQSFSRRNWLTGLLSLVLVASLLPGRWQQLPHYPNGLAADVEQVGRYIADLRARGQLRVGDTIMVEVLFWDYIPLHVVTNDPGAVVYDRRPDLIIKNGQHTLDDTTNPSLLWLPPEQLDTALRQRGVRLVIAHSQRAIGQLQGITPPALVVGRFQVFVLPVPGK